MAYSLITGAQATGVNRTSILRAKDLIGLLLGHFSGSRRAAPRCRIALRVFTPSGMPAVKIRADRRRRAAELAGAAPARDLTGVQWW
jgi:hypothetical protein